MFCESNIHPVWFKIEIVKEEYFKKYDDLLDAQDQSKYILTDERPIKIVLDSWKMLHEKGDCKIHVICIMGNHVHVILSAWPDAPEVQLGKLMRRHKTFTNKQFKRNGYKLPPGEESFWANGFFDRYIRTGTYELVFNYVVNNPQKARMIDNPRLW